MNPFPFALPFVVLCLLQWTAFAQAASFDCTKSKTGVEQKICADRELSDLDERLAEVYEFELAGADAAPIRAAQKAWLDARNRCRDNACIRQRYEERIPALLCEGRSTGSAIGSSQCAYFQTRLAERQLAPLQEKFASQVAAASNNKPYAEEVLVAEEKAWRAYRDARCALHGEREGGSDGWKNAWGGLCILEETQKRIASLKKEIQPE
ncbi:MAG TPA: lysozyme inhibitor LprI family protein [Burkholderiaceae bacterium]|nr:lysozyme inhibitor LprI family protein [Burkholderiaceae bacterium]